MQFSRHAGKTLPVTLKNGVKSDTVHKGALDAKGMATIHIPPAFSGYAGMATLKVNDNDVIYFIVNK